MKFNIKRDVLERASAFAYSPVLTSDNDALPAYARCIHVECNHGEVIFSGTNLKTFYTYSVKQDPNNLEIISTGECLVPPKTFMALLKGYKGNPWVECEVLEKKNICTSENDSEDAPEFFTFLKVKVDKASQEFVCSNPEDYPKGLMSMVSTDKEVEILASSYLDSMDKVLFACGKDHSRLDLYNVCVEFNGTDIYFVSGSGPNMAIYKVAAHDDLGQDRFLIRKEIIITNHAIFDDKGMVYVKFGKNEKNKDIVSIQHSKGTEGFSVCAKPIDKSFPDWKKIFESESVPGVITIERNILNDCLNRIANVSPKGLIMDSSDKGLYFTASSNESDSNTSCNYAEEVNTINQDLKDVFCMNTFLLKDSIKKFSGDVVNFQLSVNGNLFKITSPTMPSFTYVLALMEINDE